MKKLAAAGLIALLASGALAQQAMRAPPQPDAAVYRPAGEARALSTPSAAVILPNTQALFDGYVRDGRMPGIVAAFGVGDGPTIFPAAGAISDAPGAARVTPDTLWRIYSMTKPITGMAAMILVEEGKIGLDDPLSKYFPAFARMRVLTSPDTSLASVPATRPITIRHLLTHTGGFSYSIFAKGPLLKEYERLGILPGAMNATTEVQMRAVRPRTLAEFANRVAQAPLVAQPGTKFVYSIGVDVLGAVIEKASGMPFDRFVQTRILDPLRMRSTVWTVPRADVARFADNYAFANGSRVPFDPAATSVFLQPPSFPYGGAGLVSSARDYDRFLHMLQDGGTLDGVRIMKPATVRLAMSNLLPPGVIFGGVGNAKADARIGFGAGGSVYVADGPGGFPGKGTYGWAGAAGTYAFVDPTRRLRGTVMVNYFPSDQWPLREEIGAALAKDAARLAGR